MEKTLSHLLKAKKVGVLTGAGVSAESGVSTFRGMEGLWSQYRPEELATPEAFERDPKLVWDWYAHRRKKVLEVEPNPGHLAIAELENRFSEFLLITQNVDGLHKRAKSEQMVELHGNIMRSYCFDCRTPCGDAFETKIHESLEQGALPVCESCGGRVRPGVVWFGESLPETQITRAFEFAENCDVFFSVGTSGLVQPAASLPLIAKQKGAFTVEINTEKTPLSHELDEVILGASGEILPEIVSRLKTAGN